MKETLRHARDRVRPRLWLSFVEYAGTWRGCRHMERIQAIFYAYKVRARGKIWVKKPIIFLHL